MKSSNLPPEETKVLAKVLTEAGFSSRTVEKMLGVSDTAVLTYAKAETPEELKQFQAEMKELVDQSKKKGIVLVLKRMMEIIPRYERLDHLVKAAQYFEGQPEVGVAMQINAGGDMGISFLNANDSSETA